MKKFLLPLLLVVSLIFSFRNANAAAVAVTITNNNAGSVGATTALPSQANAVLYSFSVVNGATASATGATFTFSSGTSNINAGSATISLYSSTAATFPGFSSTTGTTSATLCGTVTTSAITSFTITDSKAVPKNTTYYYLVENFLQPTSAGAYTFSLTAAGSAAILTPTISNATGNAYSWSSYTPTSITLTSLITPGVNGLAYNPLSTNLPNPAVYGFSLTGGSTGTTASLLQLTITTPTAGGGNDYNEVLTNMTLWSSPTSTLNLNTPGTTATQLSFFTPTGTGTTSAPFNLATGTAISVAPNTTTYYFITYDEAYTQTPDEQDYGSSIGNPVTSGTQTTGFSYTVGGATVSTITAANDAAGLAPVSGGNLYQGTSGYAVAGISLKTSTSTANASNLTFTYTISGGGLFGNYFGTPQLYSSSSATFSAAATAVTGAVATTGTSTISFAIPPTAPTFNTTATYYYLVVNYTNTTGTVPATVTFVPSSYTTSAYNDKPATGLGYTSNSYTCLAPSSVLFASANTATGMAATTQSGNASNLSLFGFSVATTTATTFTNFNFTGTQTWATYFSGFTLYKNTTANFTTATAVTTATDPGLTITTTGATLNITGLNQAVNNTTEYYFLEANYTAGAATVTFVPTLTSGGTSSTTYSTTANGVPITGPTYTLNPTPPTTVTFTEVGGTGNGTPSLGLTANPITNLQTGIALYGFTLNGSGSGNPQTITSLTFAQTANATNAYNNEFFPTLTLYSSTTPTFGGVSASSSTSLGTCGTLTASYNASFTFTPSTPITVNPSTTPVYYFLVADYNYANAPNYYTFPTYQINYKSSVTASGATVTAASVAGINYSFSTITLTPTDITSGLSPVPNSNIYQGQSNLALAGVGLSLSATASSTPLTQLKFSFTPTAVATAGNYFANPPVLYSSTSSTFSTSTASPVTGATLTVTAGYVTAAITGINISSTPIYFYLVFNYSVTGGAVPQVFTFTPYSYTTGFTNSTAITTGFSSNTYTCAATVNVVASSTNGFSATTITAAQTGLALYGFGLSSYPTNTFTTFSFTSTGTVGNISNYFANLKLYSSSTNDFTTATQVTDPYVITPSNLTSTSFTITGLAQTISNSTVYYFIVLDCTSLPATGTVTFTPTLASIATSSLTYNAAANGFPLTGQTYTLQTPVTLTYYWYGSGATTDWRNPKNWITNTGNLTNAGSYPGATPTDQANFNSNYFYDGNFDEYPTIGAYNITIGTLYITNFSLIEPTINSGNSLNINTLTINDPTEDFSEFGITGTVATSTVPSVNVTGVTTVGLGCDLALYGTGSNINFGSSSALTINSNSNYFAYVYGSGGIITAAAGSTFTLAGAYAEIESSGATLNATGATFNITGNYGEIYFSGGALNATGSTFNLSGSYEQIYLAGGAMNFNAGSVLNFTGTGTGTGAKLTGIYLNAGNLAVNASTINLGTTTTPGTKPTIYNTGGVFNLNAGSVINMPGVSSAITNTGGIFIAASTSIINPSSTTAVISNPTAASTSNTFTLLSDANGSATIGQLGVGAKITGQFNVQRYISTASRNYRLVSSATNYTSATVQNSTTAPNLVNVSLLDQNATVPTTPSVTYPGAFTGGPNGASGNFTGTSSGPTMYLYQESIVPSPTYFNSSFYSGKNIGITALSSTGVTTQSTAVAVGGTGGNPADNATVVVPQGNGYLLYYIHDNTTLSSNYTLNATATTASGYINQGTIPFVLWGVSGSLTTALTNNGVSQATNPHAFAGLTMVGNPYPSSIDLQQLFTDNTSATSVFSQIPGSPEYFSELNPSNAQFVTYGYDGGTVYGSGGGSRYVASGQGFYVTVQNPNKALIFYEDEKTTSPPSFVTESIPSVSPITVDNVNTGNLKTADAVVLSAANSSANKFAQSPGAIPKTSMRVIAASSFTLNNLGSKSDTASLKANLRASRRVPLRDTTNSTDSIALNIPAAANTLPIAIAPAVASVPVAGLHLKLVQDSVNYDECGLFFSKNFIDTYNKEDAMDMDGVSGQVYLSSYTSDRVRTAVNLLGDYTNGKRVPLFVKFSTAGIFQLQLEDIANFNSNYSVFLIDNLKKDSLDLTLYKSYNFNYAPGTANDSTRFVLAIEHKPIPHYALLAFAGAKVTAGVQLSWKTLNEENYTMFVLQKLNADNTYTFLDSLKSDSAGAYDYVDQHPVLGNNTYRLQQTDGLGNITYSAPVTIGYNSTSPNGGLVIYPNPTKSTITVTLSTSSIASQVATVDIYDISGNRVEHKTVSSNSFVYDATSYKLGVYIIELKNSDGVLIGKSKFVKVQ